MENNSEQDKEVLELCSLSKRVISLMTHSIEENAIEELANLYMATVLATEILINFNHLNNHHPENELTQFLYFDFEERMNDISEKIKNLKKNGIVLTIN